MILIWFKSVFLVIFQYPAAAAAAVAAAAADDDDDTDVDDADWRSCPHVIIMNASWRLRD